MSILTEVDGSHGGRFHYVSPNTDLLAWVLSALLELDMPTWSVTDYGSHWEQRHQDT